MYHRWRSEVSYQPGFNVVLGNPEIEFNDVVDFTLITSEFTLGQDLFNKVRRLLNETQTKAIEEKLVSLLDVLYHDTSLVLGLNVSKDQLRCTPLNIPTCMGVLEKLYVGYIESYEKHGSVPLMGVLSSIAHHRLIRDDTIEHSGLIVRLYKIVEDGLLINLVNYVVELEGDGDVNDIELPEALKVSIEKEGVGVTVRDLMNSFTNIFCSNTVNSEMVKGVNDIDRMLVSLVLSQEI